MFIPKIHRPLNLPLSCEVVKKVVFGPSIFRGRGYPTVIVFYIILFCSAPLSSFVSGAIQIHIVTVIAILGMRFQVALTSEHVTGFG